MKTEKYEKQKLIAITFSIAIFAAKYMHGKSDEVKQGKKQQIEESMNEQRKRHQ